MKRAGNYHYQIISDGPVFLVHRGVAQAGRKLALERLERFWDKLSRKNLASTLGWNSAPIGGKAQFVIRQEGLAIMREKSFVLVNLFGRVWTPNRIIRFGKKIQNLAGLSAATTGQRRRGGLKF